MIGTTIAGRYEIQEQIGVGGMGVVYCAYDATLRRDVAVKFIAPHLARQADAMERFQREAQAVAGLTHPNIVAIYDFVEEPKTGGAALIMELLRGASLRGRMADANRPALSEVAIQTCRALEAAHANGILHRDIKPENIFVCRDGTLKLMDFGLARLLDSNSTQSGLIVGTISYMAPEQLRGEKLDARTDLYALGVLLYEYLAGVTPFAADNPGAVLLKHLNEPPPPLREKLSTLPAEIEAIVLKLLAKDPRDRYPSASALLAALENPTPSGKTTQVELANAFATLPTSAIPAPRPMPAPLAPLFPKPGSGGSGKGPYVVSAERKRRSLVGLLALPAVLLTASGAAGYLYTRIQAVPLTITRKTTERKAASKAVKTNPARSEATEQIQTGQEATLAREVRRERAALEQERRKREKLQRELAAKQSDPGFIPPGPDNPPPTNEPNRETSPPPVPDDAPPSPPSRQTNRPAAPPAFPALAVTGQASALQGGTARVNVQFNDNCNIRFYVWQREQGQAVSAQGSLDRLNVSDIGKGELPIDVAFSGATTPLIIMVASRRDLTHLKSSYRVPSVRGAARSFRQDMTPDLRGRRMGADTIVRALPLRE